MHPLAAGLAFGLAMFAVMNFVVLPLSAFPHPVRFSPLGTGTNLLSHMFGFGVPIALATRGALRSDADRRGRADATRRFRPS